MSAGWFSSPETSSGASGRAHQQRARLRIIVVHSLSYAPCDLTQFVVIHALICMVVTDDAHVFLTLHVAVNLPGRAGEVRGGRSHGLAISLTWNSAVSRAGESEWWLWKSGTASKISTCASLSDPYVLPSRRPFTEQCGYFAA